MQDLCRIAGATADINGFGTYKFRRGVASDLSMC
jgi:hypothetical protein